MKRRINAIALILCSLAIILLGTHSVANTQESQFLTGKFPDISGLAWLEGDKFIAVHDAKNFQSDIQPRATLIELPQSSRGIFWRFLNLNWNDSSEIAQDLESISRIPNTQYFLLAESGSLGQQFARIFLAQYQQPQLKIIAFTRFPTPVSNVEGTAVAKVGEQLIFLYAERAEGKPATEIRWASLSLQPLKIGSIEEVTFTNPIPGDSEVRLISAMEIDRESRLYVASTSDPGNKGPFSSIIWQIGAIAENENGKPQIVLCDTPKRLANVDGFKVEGLAIRELNNSKGEIFVGVDDENYGGTIRPLPISF
ncbi:hypothetical protein NIES593_11580 [Hydrococcus rivularis NIES-593]|uniref:Phytase-like domain-containing protein n=1 Tax=Hydrococcus rivularis NIES-593 TaxID=1921803 RepID=A0A1U7HGN8_9CYAN|nr:hypothetical protein [Hydrococcus rivularis]OKH22762.1 hypothetical protein NIES593_11580 [Hydrococcus rivularis NIES-593]